VTKSADNTQVCKGRRDGLGLTMKKTAQGPHETEHLGRSRDRIRTEMRIPSWRQGIPALDRPKVAPLLFLRHTLYLPINTKESENGINSYRYPLHFLIWTHTLFIYAMIFKSSKITQVWHSVLRAELLSTIQ